MSRNSACRNANCDMTPARLFGRLDQLDVLLEQRIDEFIQRNAARLCAGGQKRQHLGLEVDGRSQGGVWAVKFAAHGPREIVFVSHVVRVHVMSSSRYRSAFLRACRLAGWMR